jgi:hypothetical protein
VAGYYQINAAIRVTGTGVTAQAQIYKNGQPMKEETELDELSKDTLYSYGHKADKQIARTNAIGVAKRTGGIGMKKAAHDKATKEDIDDLDENLGAGFKKFKRFYGSTDSGDPRDIKQRLKNDPEFAKELAGRTDKVSGAAELQRRLAMKMQKEEAEVEECDNSMPMPQSQMNAQDSGVNISTNMNTKTGNKSITITADGEAAEQLAQMLKMAGMR